jgi:hypothetical protein
MFNYNTLQLRNKVITVNTVCYSIFLYKDSMVAATILDATMFSQLLELLSTTTTKTTTTTTKETLVEGLGRGTPVEVVAGVEDEDDYY